MNDGGRDPRKLRNLVQYKDMTDDEFAEAMDLLEKDWYIQLVERQVETFEARVEETMSSFEDDYDLSDMKFNDTSTLQALSRAYISLQDIDDILKGLRGEDLRKHSYLLTIMEKLSRIASDYRRDISKMEDDLKISRKIRKSTGEESAREELKKLREKASKYYTKVMGYVFCPECKMLLATVWTLYPDEEENELHFKCNRPMDESGENFCGHTFSITTKKLKELKGTNHPEGFKF